MQEKTIEDYLNLLYPNRNNLTPEGKINLTYDQRFISDHISEINAYYKNSQKPDSYLARSGMDEKSIMLMAIKDTKANFYFSLLYPEYLSLPSNEKFYLMEDYMFIASHIDRIDVYYKTCQRPGIFAYDMGYDQQEVISMAVGEAKVDYYFRLLHPEYDNLSESEQIALVREQTFIAMHINEIDAYYKDAMQRNRQNNILNSQEIIQNALNELRQSSSMHL